MSVARLAPTDRAAALAAFGDRLNAARRAAGHQRPITVTVARTGWAKVYRFHLGALTINPALLSLSSDLVDELAREIHRPRVPAAFARFTPRAPSPFVAHIVAAAAAAPDSARARTTCSGTSTQRASLRAAYDAINRDRFAQALPHDLPLRWSDRMRHRSGHCAISTGANGTRVAVEIAMNRTLLLPGQEDALLDTLAHEMAHAVAWAIDGDGGHGIAWMRRARQAGAHPAPCRSGRIITATKATLDAAAMPTCHAAAQSSLDLFADA